MSQTLYNKTSTLLLIWAQPDHVTTNVKDLRVIYQLGCIFTSLFTLFLTLFGFLDFLFSYKLFTIGIAIVILIYYHMGMYTVFWLTKCIYSADLSISKLVYFTFDFLFFFFFFFKTTINLNSMDVYCVKLTTWY